MASRDEIRAACKACKPAWRLEPPAGRVPTQETSGATDSRARPENVRDTANVTQPLLTVLHLEGSVGCLVARLIAGLW